jgi:hypothetical protein
LRQIVRAPQLHQAIANGPLFLNIHGASTLDQPAGTRFDLPLPVVPAPGSGARH